MKVPGVFLIVIWTLIVASGSLAQGGPGQHPSLGPADAPVTIVEFGDFECSQCADMHATLGRILEDYPEAVRLVFRQLPLNTIHPNAEKAAEASLCAFDQGQFWAYHDLLFGSPGSLGVESLRTRASDLELDRELFDACLDNGEKSVLVMADIEDALDAGAFSSPTLLINGAMLTGNWSYRDVARRVDAELFRLLEADVAR